MIRIRASAKDSRIDSGLVRGCIINSDQFKIAVSLGKNTGDRLTQKTARALYTAITTVTCGITDISVERNCRGPDCWISVGPSFADEFRPETETLWTKARRFPRLPEPVVSASTCGNIGKETICEDTFSLMGKSPFTYPSKRYAFCKWQGNRVVDPCFYCSRTFKCAMRLSRSFGANNIKDDRPRETHEGFIRKPY